MFCQIAFSAESFERLIKYRIADQYRPLSAPVLLRRSQSSWLDGFLVTQIAFNRVENDRFVIVNERDAAGAMIPNPDGIGYGACAVSMNLAADFFFVSARDVDAAGLGQPAVQTISVPFGPLRSTIRASVAADGIPRLEMELDVNDLDSLGLPDQVVASIRLAASSSFPFDIAAHLQGIVAPGADRVLNAGITRDDDGAVVLRFEFPGGAAQSPLARVQDWQSFFDPAFQAHLDSDGWCIDLDGDEIAAGLGAMIDPMFVDHHPIHFDADHASVFITNSPPIASITKHGVVANACAGGNVRFRLYANLGITVPSANLLRGTLNFSFSMDEHDVAMCLGLLVADPLLLFMTALEGGGPGSEIAGFARSFVSAAKAVDAVSAMTLLFIGVDAVATTLVVDARLSERPKLTQLSDGAFAFDQALSAKGPLTKDWVALRTCGSANGRLLLRGELLVPDAVLPRLIASDLEGLSKWLLIDKCDPGKGQVSDGSVTLSLAPGHGAGAARTQPVKTPTVSLKWGVRPDGGDLRYQVLDDKLGIYQDPMSEYQQVYLPGIPGIVEARLKASTVRKPRFSEFAQVPYRLHLRFYTSGGVREYRFTAPPVLEAVVETVAEAVIRINNCKHRGSDLILHEYLSLIWLGRPPESRGSVAQQWEVHVRGLAPGRKATVWNQDSGTALMRGFADRTGRVDASLILRDGEHADALLLSLDEKPFVSADELRRQSRTREHHAPRADAEVAVRQTTLTEIEHLDFDESIDSLSLVNAGEQSTLAVQTVGGQRFAHRIPSPYNAGLATRTLDAPSVLTEARPLREGRLAWRGGERQFTILSQLPGRTEILAEYSGRSSYDQGVAREDLFAQVSNDGRRLTLFQKGAPIELGSYAWVDVAMDPSRHGHDAHDDAEPRPSGPAYVPGVHRPE